MPFRVDALRDAGFDAWVELRAALWPEHPVEEHRRDARELLARVDGATVFVARSETAMVGFAEATLRVDFVNGTSSSPVVFLEGLYVVPEWRRQGVARALCDAVERWGARKGCTEFASDALIENELGRDVHAALGFAETERVVYFVKPVDRSAT